MNQKQSQHQFESYVINERQRLTDRLVEIDKRQASLIEERTAVENELAAIDAYYQIKTGHSAPTKKKAAGGRAKARATRRPTRSKSRRATILTMLKGNPTGMTRSEILGSLGIAQRDKEARSVSNALANMKKSGEIDNPNGQWVTVPGKAGG